jgi:hypothetical protein
MKKITGKKIAQGFLGTLRLNDLPVKVLDKVAKGCGAEDQDEVTREFFRFCGCPHYVDENGRSQTDTDSVQWQADIALFSAGLRLTFCERDFDWDQHAADQKELEQLRDFRKQVWAEKVRRNPDCVVTRECAEAAGLKVKYDAPTGKVSVRKNGIATPLPDWQETCNKKAGRDLSKSAISVIA